MSAFAELDKGSAFLTLLLFCLINQKLTMNTNLPMKKLNIGSAVAIVSIALAMMMPVIANAYTLPTKANTSQTDVQATVEVGFSPEGQAENLVLKLIASAHKTLRVAAYSFTSPRVVKALIEAKRRGVEVAVVVDHKNNVSEDRSGKAKAALNLLVNAGISTRTISKYAIHHSKFIVADFVSTETGSFNFSAAAASRNSENVIVVWNDRAVASQFLVHWNDRYASGVDWKSTY